MGGALRKTVQNTPGVSPSSTEESTKDHNEKQGVDTEKTVTTEVKLAEVAEGNNISQQVNQDAVQKIEGAEISNTDNNPPHSTDISPSFDVIPTVVEEFAEESPDHTVAEASNDKPAEAETTPVELPDTKIPTTVVESFAEDIPTVVESLAEDVPAVKDEATTDKSEEEEMPLLADPSLVPSEIVLVETQPNDITMKTDTLRKEDAMIPTVVESLGDSAVVKPQTEDKPEAAEAEEIRPVADDEAEIDDMKLYLNTEDLLEMMPPPSPLDPSQSIYVPDSDEEEAILADPLTNKRDTEEASVIGEENVSPPAVTIESDDTRSSVDSSLVSGLGPAEQVQATGTWDVSSDEKKQDAVKSPEASVDKSFQPLIKIETEENWDLSGDETNETVQPTEVSPPQSDVVGDRFPIITIDRGDTEEDWNTTDDEETEDATVKQTEVQTQHTDEVIENVSQPVILIETEENLDLSEDETKETVPPPEVSPQQSDAVGDNFPIILIDRGDTEEGWNILDGEGTEGADQPRHSGLVDETVPQSTEKSNRDDSDKNVDTSGKETEDAIKLREEVEVSCESAVTKPNEANQVTPGGTAEAVGAEELSLQHGNVVVEPTIWPGGKIKEVPDKFPKAEEVLILGPVPYSVEGTSVVSESSVTESQEFSIQPISWIADIEADEEKRQQNQTFEEEDNADKIVPKPPQQPLTPEDRSNTVSPDANMETKSETDTGSRSPVGSWTSPVTTQNIVEDSPSSLTGNGTFGEEVSVQLPQPASSSLTDLNKPATVIQAGIRGYLVRKQIKEDPSSLTGKKTAEEPRKEKEPMEEQPKESPPDLNKPATVIQAGIRGYLVRKQIKEDLSTVTGKKTPVEEQPQEELLKEQEPPKEELPKGESPEEQPRKEELPKEEEQPKEELLKEEEVLKEEEPPKEELPKEEEPRKEELAKEEPPKEELPKEEPPKEELPKEEPPKQELPKEEPPKEKLPKEEQTKQEPAEEVLAPDLNKPATVIQAGIRGYLVRKQAKESCDKERTEKSEKERSQ